MSKPVNLSALEIILIGAPPRPPRGCVNLKTHHLQALALVVEDCVHCLRKKRQGRAASLARTPAYTHGLVSSRPIRRLLVHEH